jgi:RNase P/RNase MRP subunit POP5
MQQVKDEMERSVQTLKHSIELVDLEVGDVKESVEFSKEYMTDLSIEIEDQKELIIHEIHSEMDRDYRDLKKFVRRNMNKHLLEEHPEDDADADEVKNEMDTDTAVNSTSVSTGTAAAAAAGAVEADVTREEANNEDMVIIMDDADFNSTDDEQ